jgi:hypothetical protein
MWVGSTARQRTHALDQATPSAPERVFNHCDVVLENDPREHGWVSILANSAGRDIIRNLFPDLPIRWHRSPRFPFDWSTADLFVSRMIEVSTAHRLPEPPPTSKWVLTDSHIARRLARGAMDYGCRVALKNGKSFSLID